MNEELQKQLAEILASAASSAGQAKDFILSEAPEVVRQLILWKFVENLSLIAIGVCFLIASALVARKFAVWKPAEPKQKPETGLDLNHEWLAKLKDSKVFDIQYHASRLAIALKVYLHGGVDSKEEDAPYHLIGISILLGLVGAIFVGNGYDFLEVWLAPKIYILEYAADLVK